MKLILLPGLDGTGILLEPLVRALPSHLAPIIIAYPAQETLGYAELTEYVKERIPKTDDFIIVGESFSGPLAVAVASGHPACLKGLVLSATFVSNPTLLPRQFSFIASSSVLAFALQQMLVKHFLLGSDVPASLLQRFQEAVRSVPYLLTECERS